MRRTVIILYTLLLAVMAVATIVGKYHGTTFVGDHVYGAWWFSVLWALLTVAGIAYFLRMKVRRPAVVALHLSFVVILAGALLTHLTAESGIVHLREGEPVTRYLTRDMRVHQLPFAVTLERFEIKCYEGTQAPADYVSNVIIDGRAATISMNHIATHKGINFIQNSYDEDLHGSVLTMNSDPWGLPVTYAGYALLFVALIWMLIDPRGAFRQALRRASAFAVLCAVCCAVNASPHALPASTADRFGRLFVVYNDRVCPMQTYAIDFTTKLYGRSHYGDYTAEQVLTGFIFFYDDWVNEPLKQDGKPMKMHERQMIIAQLHQGSPLKIFPYADGGAVTWYAPTSSLPEDMDAEHQKYIREVFTRLNGEIQSGHFDVANQYLDRLSEYQRTFGQRSLPSALQVKAERLYNRVPFTTILFMACLTIGLLLFLLSLARPAVLASRPVVRASRIALCLASAALTLCLALRWIVTASVPMSNGYETMLVLAWLILVLALFMSRRFPVMLIFGFLLAGFFLLVSHLSQMNPQMTPLMPVLNSPLLTLHVSVIMMSYALLSLTFVSSLTALCLRRKRVEMYVLSQLMLFPALAFLGLGIFVGAIWANVSWGNYWSWDPKETWALITFMVYAVPAHKSFLPRDASANDGKGLFAWHLYIAFAFLSVLITYFGVNYFLGGMHSYS